MEKISIVIPTLNEVDNVLPIVDEIERVFDSRLPDYDYEILFIDNFSKDGTRDQIIKLCTQNNKVKAVFNAKNFGPMRSPYYGLCQSSGDCSILMSADFQDPPEVLVDFVKQWEEGYKIVIGIKNHSHESRIKYRLRTGYYRLLKRIADVEHIEHFTGFALYDKDFIKLLKQLDDPYPYLRGIVSELGYEYKKIEFVQPERRSGKTKTNWYSLYDFAMLGITSYSKIILRLATIFGFFLSLISLLVAIVYLILKLANWNDFPMGTAPIVIGLFFFGSVQLFFIGLLGEYILSINTRVMKRPLVVEDRRINFDTQ